MKKNLSISNTLILLSILFTGITYIYPDFIIFGVNSYFYNKNNYLIYFLQFFTGTFIHNGILHLLFNSIFIYYFGNILESYIGKKRFLLFFISLTILSGIIITKTTNTNTIGISGFAMALLSYYTILLYSLKNPEYKGGITAIIINIAIGFYPGISFIGHFFGAIYGILFFLITKKMKK